MGVSSYGRVFSRYHLADVVAVKEHDKKGERESKSKKNIRLLEIESRSVFFRFNVLESFGRKILKAFKSYQKDRLEREKKRTSKSPSLMGYAIVQLKVVINGPRP